MILFRKPIPLKYMVCPKAHTICFNLGDTPPFLLPSSQKTHASWFLRFLLSYVKTTPSLFPRFVLCFLQIFSVSSSINLERDRVGPWSKRHRFIFSAHNLVDQLLFILPRSFVVWLLRKRWKKTRTNLRIWICAEKKPPLHLIRLIQHYNGILKFWFCSFDWVFSATKQVVINFKLDHH